jgi:capsular polysaccharide export protein
MVELDLPSDIADWLAENSTEKDVQQTVQRLGKQNSLRRAANIVNSARWTRSTAQHRHRVLRTLLNGGLYDRSAEVCTSLLNEADIGSHPKIEHAAGHTLGLIQQFRVGSEFLARAPRPTSPKGLVVFYNVQNPIVSGLMVPLAFELSRQGYPSVAAVTATITTPPTGISEFDELSGSIAPDGQSFVDETSSDHLRHNWKIDWQAGVAEVDGINYFAYLHERVAQKARKYTIDIADDPDSSRYFAVLLRQSDVALTLCEKLLKLSEIGLPIRIGLMDSHFAPAGIIRQWCYEVGARHGIHIVAMGVSYENYFSNLTTSEAGTLVIDDMTAQPNLRAPVLGGAYRFKQFLAENPHMAEDADETVLSWITQNRSLSEDGSEDRQAIIKRIREVRSKGRKVFLSMGKVSIDFAAPGDRGLAHSDFIDWMSHLIASVSKTDNLLLIKPHPHELRKEIVVNGVQMLRDLIPKDLPDNVIFLPHSAFNSHEMASDIDAVFLWNGMGTVEFPILGVPAVPASIWNEHDYPVGTEVLKTRKEYEQFLSGKRQIAVTPELRKLCAGYLRFLRSDNQGIPFRYLRRAAVNAYVGPPILYEEDLDRLEKYGDPYVERAAQRFFWFTRTNRAPKKRKKRA